LENLRVARPQYTARLAFGPFELDASASELRKRGVRLRLTGQPFQILLEVLAHPGEVVTREQLCERIWRDGTFVDFEHGLSAAMNKLRRALGDSAENPRYIETVPGRGYRFIGMLEGESSAAAATPVLRQIWTELAEQVAKPDIAPVQPDSVSRPLSAVEIDPVHEQRSPSKLFRRWIWIGVGALGLSMLLGFAVLRLRTTAAIPINSIAVLPFVNTTHDPNTEYLSDGLTESLVSSLSQLPDLKVMARSTVFRYKGNEEDPQKIGQALQVSAILMGRVTQHGDEVGVQTDLVNTADGTELWGSHYDRKLADITQLQSDITRDVSSRLRIQLSDREQQRLGRAGTANPVAYRLYLEGRQLWYGRTPEGLKKSIDLFQQAIVADPKYALAYTGLADTYNVAPSYGTGIPSRQAFLLADEAARKALELDNSLSEAHSARAMALAVARRWSEAEPEFRRAIELNPNNATAHYFYAIAFLMPESQIKPAQEEFQIALSLDPLSSIVNTNYATFLMQAHRYPESLAQFQKVLARDPNFPPLHYRVSQLYATIGRFAEAVREIQWGLPKPHSGGADANAYREASLGNMSPEYPDTVSAAAVACAISGQRDQAFRYLEEAYAAGHRELLFVIRLPAFDQIRSDPRYADLMRRLGLPE
jgi:TolB-like protein/DNA-binding winged helix-turn-helix (wHTH) protein